MSEMKERLRKLELTLEGFSPDCGLGDESLALLTTYHDADIKATALKIAEAAKNRALEIENFHGRYASSATTLNAFATHIESHNWGDDSA